MGAILVNFSLYLYSYQPATFSDKKQDEEILGDQATPVTLSNNINIAVNNSNNNNNNNIKSVSGDIDDRIEGGPGENVWIELV